MTMELVKTIFFPIAAFLAGMLAMAYLIEWRIKSGHLPHGLAKLGMSLPVKEALRDKDHTIPPTKG